jgi:hypothetical protein
MRIIYVDVASVICLSADFAPTIATCELVKNFVVWKKKVRIFFYLRFFSAFFLSVVNL